MKWQTQRDVHRLTKSQVFEYRQTLVVVHRHHHIAGSDTWRREGGICWHGSLNIHALLA